MGQPAVDRGQSVADQLPARRRFGTILSTLIETGLNPKRLEIEITEGVLIADFARAISLLGKIKALGVRIAMDDFGTGYSSLSYLQSFSFDKIKINQTFIGNLGSNPHSAAIIQAIIGLGRALKLPGMRKASKPRRSSPSSSRKDAPSFRVT